MSNEVAFGGLSYKRLDLHIHTPASKCFLGECTSEQVVEAAIQKNLDAIAVTDHNTAQWIDPIKAAAKGKPLVVFPGVEISCAGGKKNVHVIALLDPSATARDVEVILNILGITPKDYGRQEAMTDKGAFEAIQIIHDNGGLAVLAHANSSNGVLSDMVGQQRTRIIASPLLLATEATDFDDPDKKETRKRVVDLLDGSDPTYGRKLAVYQASDNPASDGSGRHSIDGIGAKYSYFKMEKIDILALRQCFVDPDVRIRINTEAPIPEYPRINRVRVNSGFLEGQEAVFHPGLTSILGAKGAGKSLLIEFMRFALNQEPQHPSIAKDHISKLRSRLGEFGVVEVTFVDENGKESTIERAFRELDESPYAESVPYDPAQVFPVLFLSQNEIIAIAENETEQLQFIDHFFDFHAFRSRITVHEKELERLDKIMAEGLKAFSEHDDIASKLGTMDKEGSKLDEALKNPIFERFQQLERKEGALRDQRDYLVSIAEGVVNARQAILNRSAPQIPENLKQDPALLRNTSLIGKAQETIAEALATLSRDLEKTHQRADQEYKTWHTTYEGGKKEYEDYVQKIGGDYKAIALSRERLVKQRAQLQIRLDTVNTKKEGVKSTSKSRDELLDALQAEYAAYTAERKGKCEKFMRDSKGKLKLRIIDQSNVESFMNSLLSLKRGSYLRDDEIITITTKIKPRDFVMALLRYDATKESKHLIKVSQDSDIELKRMKTLADFLLSALPYEELLALQYRAQPQDRPEILYETGAGQFRPLSQISVGQKCTALLIMALSDGIMPIVIDQPEDSLDIRSIWEDVCKKLRSGKESRQFVFTTHNSSLAVASDTDCYLIFEGDALRGRVVHIGAMDHPPVGPEVMKYLEGGLDTYHVKYEKYGRTKRIN